MFYVLTYLVVGVLLGLGRARGVFGRDGWTASEGKSLALLCAVSAFLWPLLLVAAWRGRRRQGGGEP